MFEKEFPNFKEICLEINQTYSKTHRIVNCIEELSELQKEFCKLLRYHLSSAFIQNSFRYDCNYKDTIRRKILKEIADVYITIEESKNILEIEDNEIIEEMRLKLNRGVR